MHALATDPLAITVFGYLVTWAVPIVMLYIVPKDRNPAAAIAWLVVIAVFPYIGLIAYFLLANPRLPRARRRRQQSLDALIAEQVKAQARRPGRWDDMEPMQVRRLTALATMNERLGGLPLVSGDRVELCADYDAGFVRMAEDIRAARHTAHIEFYIMAMDESTEPVFAAMEEAAARGVDVKVLFDHVGSRSYPRHGAMLRRLRRAGIGFQRMLPILPFDGEFARPDLRNHRKLVIVDGLVGWIGSQNLIDRTYLEPKNRRAGLHYEEVMARVEGPTAVQLDTVFRMDWYAECGELPDAAPTEPARDGASRCQIIPSGPSHPYENNLHLFNNLLYQARERVVLVNPYFVPDDTLVAALTSAAHRGVQVTLITCQFGNHKVLNHAQRSYYETLLRAGVRVLLRPHPGILHTKTMTVDDDILVIGSSNLDMRSFHINLEVTMMVWDPDVVARMREIEAAYEAVSPPLVLEDWQRRPVLGRWLDSVARLTASLQ